MFGAVWHFVFRKGRPELLRLLRLGFSTSCQESAQILSTFSGPGLWTAITLVAMAQRRTGQDYLGSSRSSERANEQSGLASAPNTYQDASHSNFTPLNTISHGQRVCEPGGEPRFCLTAKPCSQPSYSAASYPSRKSPVQVLLQVKKKKEEKKGEREGREGDVLYFCFHMFS